MNTWIIKLFGTAVLSVAAVGTVGVMALDIVPADMPGWTKGVRTKVVAVDTGASRDVLNAGSIPVGLEPAKEGMPDILSLSAVPEAPPPWPVSTEQSSGTFRVGDKLKIGFYERMEFDEEKWGRQRPSRSSFQQRTELSGEYLVSDDGAISIPLLGSISVAKRSIKELEAALAGASESLIGRKGFVTITALERQPIYVLGPVKNPGSYKYAPGMTVLHAVALAGGLQRTQVEPWERMEAVRETGKKHGAIERTTRLMARVAVLKSEYLGSQAQIPARLVEIVGSEAARSAVREQKERRQPVVWMRSIRKSAAEAAFDSAKREVETLADGIVPIEQNIKLRAGRVESLRALKNNNIVANTVLVQAQSELSDVQERRQSAINALGLAKYRYATAEQELARQQAEAQIALEQEIATAEQDIADAERDIGSSDGVLNVVQEASLRHEASTGETSLAYEIVRQGPQGAVVMSSVGTTSLEPGDLVRILTKVKSGSSLTIDAKLP